jgi:hypothetical protein
MHSDVFLSYIEQKLAELCFLETIFIEHSINIFNVSCIEADKVKMQIV